MTDLFKMLAKSFWSPAAYFEVITRWRFKIAAYFLLLTLISSLIFSYSTTLALRKDFKDNEALILSQIPQITLKDGVISTPDGKTVCVLNASGKKLFAISPLYMKPADSMDYKFTVQKDKFCATLFDDYDYESPLADFNVFADEQGVLDFKKISDFIFVFSAYFAIPVLTFFGGILSNIFYIAVMAFAIRILSFTLDPRLTYKRCLKFATVAITPATFIAAFASFFPQNSLMGTFYGLITLGLAWYIMRRMPAFND